MPGIWRLVNTGYRSGAENMAIDEAILLSIAQGEAPPTIRFYGWSPACLSIGYSQDWVQAVNEEACAELGVDCVRRPTGGRAVLHEHEVTYAVVVPEGHRLLPKGVTESYRVLSQGILRGLQSLGVPAQMASGHNQRKKQGTAACFDATSWYELVVDGRKLVGSAQMRRGGVILQHGSILVRFDPRKLLYVLYGKQHSGKANLVQGLAATAVSLGEVLERQVGFTEVANALSAGWEETLAISLVALELTKAERQLAAQLVQEKYGCEEWNVTRVKPRVV